MRFISLSIVGVFLASFAYATEPCNLGQEVKNEVGSWYKLKTYTNGDVFSPPPPACVYLTNIVFKDFILQMPELRVKELKAEGTNASGNIQNVRWELTNLSSNEVKQSPDSGHPSSLLPPIPVETNQKYKLRIIMECTQPVCSATFLTYLNDIE